MTKTGIKVAFHGVAALLLGVTGAAICITSLRNLKKSNEQKIVEQSVIELDESTYEIVDVNEGLIKLRENS